MRLLILPLLLAAFASPALAQTPVVSVDAQYTQGSTPVTHTAFQVNNDGAFVARGFVRDVGNTTGCAGSLPASGAGTRFMWDPCRGAVRFGRVPTGQTNWDDANLDDFTFAGGNQVTASGYGAFAYGDQVNVSSTVGVGFGSAVTVSGTAGFSSGASNQCTGFACTAMGYSVRAGGQGSASIGYRTIAQGDYTVALGYRATSCDTNNFSSTSSNFCPSGSRTGSFTWADESTTNYIGARADNSFNIRAAGGVWIFTNAAQTSGLTMAAGGSSWNVVSDRNRKEAFADLDGEALLGRLASLPVTTWRYKAEADRTVRHVGPMAQDWQRLVAGPLGLNADSTVINQGDFDGVNLAGVVALEARTRALAEENASLRSDLDALRAEVAALQTERPGPLQAALPPLGVLVLLGLAGAFVRQRRTAGDA